MPSSRYSHAEHKGPPGVGKGTCAAVTTAAWEYNHPRGCPPKLCSLPEYFSNLTKVESDTSAGTHGEIVLAQAPRPVPELLTMQLLAGADRMARQEAGIQ